MTRKNEHDFCAYDSLVLRSGTGPDQKMFGNDFIGNMRFTNMEVAYRVTTGEQEGVITGMSAVAHYFERDREMAQLILQNTFVSLVQDGVHRGQWLPVSELVDHRLDVGDIDLGSRSLFHVQVQLAYQRFKRYDIDTWLDNQNTPPFTLRVMVLGRRWTPAET